jgi:pimeloyl-ACP methyl ester carboxylesterase
MIDLKRGKMGGIAYWEAGEGLPFLALHGYTLDHRMTAGAFEPLFATSRRAGRFRRLYPDLPFMGESEDLAEESGSDAILEALLGFIAELTPSGPLLIAGQSYGGYLARGLARALAREPGERVAGLFFLCPMVVAAAADRDRPPAGLLFEEAGWDREASEDERAEFGDCAVIKSRAAFERFRAELLPGIALARRERLERLQAGRYAFSFDSMGRGGEPFDPPFERPVSFFLGRQDSSVGWRDALRLAERYPRASYHVVDGAGHNAQLEAPCLFGAAFAAWLEKCYP